MAWYRAHVKPANVVLLVWKAPLDAEEMQSAVDSLKDSVGHGGGEVRVENFDFVEKSLHPSGSFDVILSGVFAPYKADHTLDTLTTYLRLLRPGGSLVLCERDKRDSLASKAKIAGFTVEVSFIDFAF
jgi:ribosomal protein RSM22 (predicted rRNA methylase)